MQNHTPDSYQFLCWLDGAVKEIDENINESIGGAVGQYVRDVRRKRLGIRSRFKYSYKDADRVS